MSVTPPPPSLHVFQSNIILSNLVKTYFIEQFKQYKIVIHRLRSADKVSNDSWSKGVVV